MKAALAAATPRFSLIVLTYDRPGMLGNCLESLCRQGPLLADAEVLVVDDGSARGVEETLRRYRGRLDLRCLRQPHAGVSSARNLGMRDSRGEIVAFIADDYRLPPGYLAAVDRFFRRHPEGAAVTFNMRSCAPGVFARAKDLYFELTLLQNLPDPEGGEFVPGRRLPASRAAAFRRSVFERVGGFRHEAHGGEDFEMSLRMEAAGLPVHFCRGLRVEHDEPGGLRYLLGQRVRYARNFLRLLREKEPWRSPEFPLSEALRRTAAKYAEWLRLSARVGLLGRYLALSPALLLFLGVYWLGVHRSARAR